MEIVNALVLVILGTGYFWLAVWPKRSASLLVHYLDRKNYEISKLESFWNLYDDIRRRRRLIIAIIITLIFSVSVADIVLLDRVKDQLFPHYGNAAMGIIVVFLLCAGYALMEFTGYGKISILQTEHGRKAEARSLLDTLSIAAGTSAPQCVVISHSIPTAFSIHANKRDTVVYLTSALLNIASKTELEAVLAHEVANRVIKRNSNLRLINNLLGLFNVLSYLLLLVVLYNLDPSLLTLWLVNTASSYLRSVRNLNFSPVGDHGSFLELTTTLTNPLLLVSRLLSHTTFFLLSRKEFLFSDLKAIELTRYPQGLYSILSKLLVPFHAFRPLPAEYGHLYFTGESVLRSGEPMIQPPIQMRLNMIEQLDSRVKASVLEKSPSLLCPVCKFHFLPCRAKNMYQHSAAWYACLKSQHLWFDNYALYYLSNSSVLTGMEALKFMPVNREYAPNEAALQCPRCKITLRNITDRFLPSSMQIYHCPSCEGDLVSRQDFETYVRFRLKRQRA